MTVERRGGMTILPSYTVVGIYTLHSHGHKEVLDQNDTQYKSHSVSVRLILETHLDIE